jgi:hypothetical protein
VWNSRLYRLSRSPSGPPQLPGAGQTSSGECRLITWAGRPSRAAWIETPSGAILGNSFSTIVLGGDTITPFLARHRTYCPPHRRKTVDEGRKTNHSSTDFVSRLCPDGIGRVSSTSSGLRLSSFVCNTARHSASGPIFCWNLPKAPKPCMLTWALLQSGPA